VDTVTQVVHEQAPKARVIRSKYEPVVGAALLALEAIGIDVNASLYHMLESTLPDRLAISRSESSAV